MCIRDRLTQDEARALLAMSAPPIDNEPKPIAAYVLPHPRTTGVGHTVESALTVVTAPLWALGLFGFAWARMRYRSGTQVAMGELRATFTIAGFGAPLLWFPAMWGLGSTVATAAGVGEGGAGRGRGVGRGRALGRVELGGGLADAGACGGDLRGRGPVLQVRHAGAGGFKGDGRLLQRQRFGAHADVVLVLDPVIG